MRRNSTASGISTLVGEEFDGLGQKWRTSVCGIDDNIYGIPSGAPRFVVVNTTQFLFISNAPSVAAFVQSLRA